MNKKLKAILGVLAIATQAVGWFAAVAAVFSITAGVVGIIVDPASGYGWLAVIGVPLGCFSAVVILAGRLMWRSLRNR